MIVDRWQLRKLILIVAAKIEDRTRFRIGNIASKFRIFENIFVDLSMN